MKAYSDFDVTATPGILTGVSHIDNLLSTDKGFQSAVIFMTGTSGAGKTTLSKLFQKLISDTPTALYERETSSGSVAKQTRRIEISHKNAMLCDERDYPTFTNFMAEVEKRNIKFIIIDSLQTAATDFEQLDGMSEKEAQMKVLSVLSEWRKKTGGVAVLIGMVNKDGDFSGVNKIKHLADCHLHLVYDKVRDVRFMQTTKNRDNSTSKVYYEFVDSDEIVKFYTETEFEAKGQKIKFDEYLHKTIGGFMSLIDKKHENYKIFITELNAASKGIYESHANGEISSSQYLGGVISKLNDLLIKYNIQG